jgi:Na+-translocating ferredoxin:NAD+ oxidoreductase RNF subunit RnfB
MQVNEIIYPIVSLGGLGVTFGVLLGYASKKFAVEVDPKVPLVRDALPGANCGACGYAGCDACAKAMVEGEAAPNACPVGGADCATKVGEVLGLAVEVGERNVAFVKCNGTCDKSKDKYEYYGVMDCREAALIPGGGAKACSYGCLGLSSCVKVCEFDAIHVVAVVDEDKCTSCGKCVGACPKGLINIVPVEKQVRVACNSKDKGKEVKDNCSVGCIGCTLCVKACKFDAMKFENSLAQVDYDKCTLCNACAQKCPTKAINGIKVSCDESIAN